MFFFLKLKSYSWVVTHLTGAPWTRDQCNWLLLFSILQYNAKREKPWGFYHKSPLMMVFTTRCDSHSSPSEANNMLTDSLREDHSPSIASSTPRSLWGPQRIILSQVFDNLLYLNARLFSPFIALYLWLGLMGSLNIVSLSGGVQKGKCGTPGYCWTGYKKGFKGSKSFGRKKELNTVVCVIWWYKQSTRYWMWLILHGKTTK